MRCQYRNTQLNDGRGRYGGGDHIVGSGQRSMPSIIDVIIVNTMVRSSLPPARPISTEPSLRPEAGFGYYTDNNASGSTGYDDPKSRSGTALQGHNNILD